MSIYLETDPLCPFCRSSKVLDAHYIYEYKGCDHEVLSCVPCYVKGRYSSDCPFCEQEVETVFSAHDAEMAELKEQSIRELLNQTIGKCLEGSRSGLILPICTLFQQLEERKEIRLSQCLKEKLTPLGLDPKSENFGWLQEPPEQELLLVLVQFGEQLPRPLNIRPSRQRNLDMIQESTRGGLKRGRMPGPFIMEADHL